MINPSFNQDINFSKGNIDIKELNAFMNEKKKKIEKELTKYDVDRDTQAKSQNVQHLSQMPKYLPLFTKKIKDHKAMKKQKATKEMDYTKKKQEGTQLVEEVKQKEQQQSQVVVVEQFDPREIQEREFKINLSNTQQVQIPQQETLRIAQNISMNLKDKSKEYSKSPAKYDPRSNGRYQEEQLNKVSLIDRENYLLRSELEQRKQEHEKISFKYAKAQSRFIEIMRELSRFRDDFNDQYSVRSKLKKIQGVTQQINTILKAKDQLLLNEEETLKKFYKMEAKLFESDSPNSKQTAKTRRSSQVAVKQQVITQKGEDLRNKFCQIRDQSKTKFMIINNIKCLVTYEVSKKKATCTVNIYPQVSHEVFTHTFIKITEKFDPLKEIKLLQFKSHQGQLQLECTAKAKDKWINREDDEIYYQNDNIILKYVHGCPFRLVTIGITPIEQKQHLAFTVLEKDFNKHQCTVEITEEKVFKDILPHSLQNRHFEDEVLCIMYRKNIVASFISKYIKKYLQIGDIDASPSSPALSGLFRNKGLLTTGKYTKLAMFDREQKGIKIRRKSFVGGRISNQTLGGFGNSTTMLKPDRRISNAGGSTLKNATFFLAAFEKMKDAVINHINKKKEIEKTNLNSHLGLAQPRARASISPIKKSIQVQEETKMSQIMKLIYANSMYATIHFELFIIERDDFPVYLELVHNTDDDSILLFIVADPKDFAVKEIRLDSLESSEWLMIKQRFGGSAEQYIFNIETIFRTLEFLSIVKTLSSNKPLDKSAQELGVPFGSKRKSTESQPGGNLPTSELNMGTMTIKIN